MSSNGGVGEKDERGRGATKRVGEELGISGTKLFEGAVIEAFYIKELGYEYNPINGLGEFRQWQATVFSFEKRGYIERIKGTHFGNSGWYTRIKPTEKFTKEIIKKYNISYKNLIQIHPLIELGSRKKVNRSAKRVFDIERRLNRYNDLLINTDITFPSSVLDNSNNYNLAYRTYKRSFKNSFSKNGRFY